MKFRLCFISERGIGMLNMTVVAVGKLNAAYFRQAAAEYEKRLGAFCRIRVVELAECPVAEKNASPAQIEKALEKEGAAILSAVPKNAALVALCVEGSQLSSEKLAQKLQVGRCRAFQTRRLP